MIQIKELNKEQISRANNNSFSGKRGDTDAHEYEVYCNRVISWGLSERETQKIINKVYEYFSKSLFLDSQHVSVAVAGASNYNAKRLDKSDRILDNSAEFCKWFNELEEQANMKPYNRIQDLARDVVWGVNGDYSTARQWKELAARDRKYFESLYEKLSESHEFKKSSTPYKIYHNILAIEPIIQEQIYKDNDLTIYKEQGKICIRFRLKPQRQLIVALKSRNFYWIAVERVWKANATDELIDWAKTIAERYDAYI